MKSVKRILFLLIFLQPLTALAMRLDEFQARLQSHVDKVAEKRDVSVRIEVLGSGTELFSFHENQLLVPASNTKLITTMAALDKLGPGFTFETTVHEVGGDLLVTGNGDPYLVSERLWLLARQVVRSGVKKVKSIRIDTSKFSKDYNGLLSWTDSGEPFAALVAPVSVNFNSLEIHLSPDAKGKKVKIELGPVPHGYGKIKNSVEIVPGTGKSIKVKRAGEAFEVIGELGRESAPVIVYAAVENAEIYFAHVFAALLRHEGVSVEKEYGGKVAGGVKLGRLLARQESLPLLDLVRLFNTYSNNFMTEQVFQAIGGWPASLESSQSAVMSFLAETSGCKKTILENGSGLSFKTQVSATCLVQLLQKGYRDFRHFADLLGSMPVGGATGTLKSRFRKFESPLDSAKVRAKTGTLTNERAVATLSGFTQARSGEVLVFSFLQNGRKGESGLLPSMREWEDKCIEYMQQLEF